MNIFLNRVGRERAFTLTELMTASAIFAWVVAAMVVSNLYGIRLFELSRAKLGASDSARRALNGLVENVREAKSIDIGTGSATNFNEIVPGNNYQGNAIQVYPTTNTTDFVRFFWQNGQLKKTSGNAATPIVLVSGVRNNNVFSSEDFQGNVLTNGINNHVIGLWLVFTQLVDPTVHIGSNELFNYYEFKTKMTKRALE
jgi:prepilin-type N-terminal cleavage/methylation domain-containing protein